MNVRNLSSILFMLAGVTFASGPLVVAFGQYYDVLIVSALSMAAGSVGLYLADERRREGTAIVSWAGVAVGLVLVTAAFVLLEPDIPAIGPLIVAMLLFPGIISLTIGLTAVLWRFHREGLLARWVVAVLPVAALGDLILNVVFAWAVPVPLDVSLFGLGLVVLGVALWRAPLDGSATGANSDGAPAE